MCEQIIENNGKDRTFTIKNAKLHHDSNGYFLDMTYTIETPEEIRELHIPKVMLTFSENKVRIVTDYSYLGSGICHVDLGFGGCHVLKDRDGCWYTVETIKEKTREMTLEEIEKKLGHKVKIVSDKK